MSWISKLFYGVDLDEEQARSDAADAQLDQLNAHEIERGRYNAEIQGQIESNQTASASNYHARVDDQVNDEFAAGAREGFDNSVGAVAGAIKDGAVGIARGVPWWVWLLLVVGALGYLGAITGIFRRP